MSLRDFFKRRRKPPDTTQGDDRRSERRPELRDAWLAFETDCPDRALRLATQYTASGDAELAADAKKLVALIRFNRGQYDEALALFQDIVAVHNDAGNWFNIATTATLCGDIESGRDAFDRALAAIERGDVSGGASSAVMRQYYACALRDRGEFTRALEQIEELRAIYEQLRITDDTFVYIRGVPFLSHTMDVAVDVFRGLGDSFDCHRWIDSFAAKLDVEGRHYLSSVKQRLMDGTKSRGEREPV